MAVNLSPVGGVAAQFFDNDGNVLSGGKIFTYSAGTNTPAATYTTSAGSIAHSNPIILDSAGRVPSGEIWLTDGINYKFVLNNSSNVLIGTYDNISGINSNFISFTNSQQIITATANQTVFNLSINYQPGTNSLSVFVDGVNQYGPGAQYAYTETDSDTVTFVSGLHVGAQVKFTTSQQQGAGAVNASQVSYTPAGTGAVPTNVQAKLRQTVSVKDFGAVGDGTTDDTTAIQAAINSGNSLYFPKGTYAVNSALYPISDTTWYGFKAATLKWTTSACLIDVQSKNNWVIDGLVVDGNFTAYSVVGAQTPWGIRLESSTNILITNCVFKNLYRIGICVGHQSATQCSNVTIQNNVIHNCGSLTDPSPGFGNGIAIISASQVAILNNYIYDINGSGGNATAGIDLEPDPAWNCSDIEIAFNKITNVLNASGIQLYPGGTPFTGDWNNISIHDNVIKSTGTAQGIACTEFGITYIRDNFLEQTQGILVKRYQASEVAIEGNDIRQVTTGGYGIRIQDGIAAATIRGNSIRNVAGVGIQCDMYDLVTGMNQKGCVITDNDLQNINSHGIAITAGNFVVSNNVLVGCSVTNTSGYFITSISGTPYTSINGFIGGNTMVQVGVYTINAFIRAEGDVFDNVVFGSNTFVGAALTYLTTSLGGRCPGVYMDVTPTGGTWKVGDVVNKLTPTAGGTIGWVCTTAGTPGTFKTFGAISA